jgi:basic membrane protein A
MRKVSGLLAAVLVFGVAGCGDKKTSGGATGDGKAGGTQIRAAMVTDTGGIDDLSFNAGAWAGLQRAEKELGIKARKPLESKEQADYKVNLSSLAEHDTDFVVAVGFAMRDTMAEIAKANPNVKFAIIDGKDPGLTNTVGLQFREEEGSFLAGYLAGRMSKTGAIGFVGGQENTLIKKFENGYKAGALTANPAIRVIPKYVGGWSDVAKGQEMADAEFSQGVDIIFAAAGKSGLGVLDAAARKGPGFYGIGCDGDQDGTHPGRVLASMMKGVDNAIFDTVKSIKDGSWKPGDHVFGIKEGGLHLSPMKYTKQDVPADVLQKIDVISKMIADGKIIVPKTDEEQQNFKTPKI